MLSPMPKPLLSDLLDPSACVLVTQEIQGGVVGDQAGLPDLAKEFQRSALPNSLRLVQAARSAGVPVVHCLANRRTDGRGSNVNCRLFQLGERFPVDITHGSPGGSLLPEFGPEPTDIVLSRIAGLGPMGGTDLESVLRNLGARTIVGIGVSVNVAITNFVMDAVNAGFWFVLPRDAVAGVPTDYDQPPRTRSILITLEKGIGTYPSQEEEPGRTGWPGRVARR